ncbi:hypothetical protein G4G27_21420 [Sphingomonas sp. So64.6b]|uniref:hypothetical protein n=1 Tax=Sphingomonas sp. So64.6b TaxID=2997354 RepID=UPI00160496F9|nr:hypothetical protein [Sphingomonas sp. So64.6b]QNA86250.1 hypothetical protein G4G27_21420 [Sphingomonas sp. So64.6b]
MVVDHEPTWAENSAAARRVVEEATAIFDGEVIEAEVAGVSPARVRAVRMFKGSRQDEFLIEANDSCDLFFDRVGERSRFILFGGPERFSTSIDGSNARAIDRLLKSDRRKDWPFVPGQLLATRP